MSRFSKDFFKVALGLTSAIFLVTTLQIRIATAEVVKPRALLLAQKAEPETAKTPCPATLPQKPAQPKAVERPQPQPERMERKIRTMGPMRDEPERAGTKKIGGQAIRAKETPQGE
jgi:hypothetical protein